MKTAEVSNSDAPIFNERVEFLTQEFIGSKLTFKVDDNDVWPNSDDPIGAYSMVLSRVRILVTRSLTLSLETLDLDS